MLQSHSHCCKARDQERESKRILVILIPKPSLLLSLEPDRSTYRWSVCLVPCSLSLNLHELLRRRICVATAACRVASAAVALAAIITSFRIHVAHGFFNRQSQQLFLRQLVHFHSAGVMCRCRCRSCGTRSPTLGSLRRRHSRWSRRGRSRLSASWKTHVLKNALQLCHLHSSLATTSTTASAFTRSHGTVNRQSNVVSSTNVTVAPSSEISYPSICMMALWSSCTLPPAPRPPSVLPADDVCALFMQSLTFCTSSSSRELSLF